MLVYSWPGWAWLGACSQLACCWVWCHAVRCRTAGSGATASQVGMPLPIKAPMVHHACLAVMHGPVAASSLTGPVFGFVDAASLLAAAALIVSCRCLLSSRSSSCRQWIPVGHGVAEECFTIVTTSC